MIITDRLGVSAMVDAAQPQELLDAACEAAAQAGIREVVRAGEEAGAFVREQSVWVTRVPSVIVPQRMQVRVEWSPDPTEGVELRGGPLDGSIVHVPRGADGRPISSVQFPQPMRDVLARPEQTHDPMSLPGPIEYILAGIDSERDRWVYTHAP